MWACAVTDAGSTDKQRLHQLVESLPAEQIPAALRYLNYLSVDPMLLSLLNAPPDDEPYTDEQRVQDAEAADSIARGEGVTQEDVQREFGP